MAQEAKKVKGDAAAGEDDLPLMRQETLPLMRQETLPLKSGAGSSTSGSVPASPIKRLKKYDQAIEGEAKADGKAKPDGDKCAKKGGAKWIVKK